ncbi:MAG: HipA family kinase [Salinisphaera sp.]|uniref:HipA family kinase n=1 Tax=Salinisphaera sp. TaxID=1914330 RepID=UPI003C7B73AF
MLEIVEVIERSTQGKTRPFICRGDDDAVYFVKGCDAGKRSLICEWICGCLARHWQLPIPDFEIAYVPPQLMSGPKTLELSDLGSGPVFASKRRRGTELSWHSAQTVPPKMKQDVLLFDWWIKNGDRTLTAHGGNPNLFWAPDAQELVVIDHNVAIDATVTSDNFFIDHVFCDQASAVVDDLVTRAEYTRRMNAAMARWDAIIESIPDEWRYLDTEQLDPVAFDWSAAYALLTAFESNDFWAIR